MSPSSSCWRTLQSHQTGAGPARRISCVNICQQEFISDGTDDTLGHEPEQALERREVVSRTEVIHEGERGAHSGGLRSIARIAK